MRDASSKALEALFRCPHLMLMGAGGSGRSTVCAALSYAASSRGRLTLSVDAFSGELPSALAAAFSLDSLPLQVTRVEDNLFTVRVTGSAGHRRFLKDTLRFEALSSRISEWPPARDWMDSVALVEAMGALYETMRLMEELGPASSSPPDLCIVDAPSLERAAALLRLPALLLEIIPSGPIARAIHQGRSLVTDPTRCGVVLVTRLNERAVGETRWFAGLLRDCGVPLRLVVANRTLCAPQRAAASAGPREALEERLRTGLEAELGLPIVMFPELPLETPAGLARRLAAGLT